MEFREILEFIENHKAPYNNNQTAEWNENVWKQSLLWDLKKECERRCLKSSSEQTTGKASRRKS